MKRNNLYKPFIRQCISTHTLCEIIGWPSQTKNKIRYADSRRWFNEKKHVGWHFSNKYPGGTKCKYATKTCCIILQDKGNNTLLIGGEHHVGYVGLSCNKTELKEWKKAF